MKTTSIYTRLWDGKILTANVISMTEQKVVYYFSNPKKLIKENTKLFLSVFSIK
jgi:hypothetical protein